MSDIEKLKKLKELYADGLLTKEEYDSRRLAIIDGQILNLDGAAAATDRAPRDTTTSPRATASSPRATASSPRTRTTSNPSRVTATSPRRTERSRSPQQDAAPVSRSPEGRTSPRAASPRGGDGRTSPRGGQPRPKFDASQPYDPRNTNKAKDPHQKPSIPMAPRGQVGTRFEMPAAVREFTQIRVVQEPENPKVGVYLGPKGGTGGVYSSQADVRKKVAIGAPEVSTRAHIGSAADKVSSVKLYTLGNKVFEERIFANTNVQDMIAACVRKLEVLHPPSLFGMIHKKSSGESWLSPDTLMHEVPSGGQLIVLPKQSAIEDAKKDYFSKVNERPQIYHVETDGPTYDVESAPNMGAQRYYAYNKNEF